MDADLPPPRPSPHSRLTLAVRRDLLADRAAHRVVVRRGRARTDPELIEQVRAEVDVALPLFAERGWIDAPSTYHDTPAAPEGIRTSVRRTGNLRYTSVTWMSGYEVRPDEPGSERFATYARNGIARAALLEHRSGERPWLVCVHGFGMGTPGLDLRAMRALHLFRDLGLNVTFVTLPFHGRRNPRGRGLPQLPGPDVLDTIHGLTQAVWDVRAMLAHLRARSGAPIGVMGLSLGGLVSALVSSLDDVDATVLLVPVVDLGTLIVEAAERYGPATDGTGDVVDRARQLLRPLSPLVMEPRVDPKRRLIVAGTLDRFVRPSAQAVALWHHWDEPPVHWYHGGHVSLFWARGVQDAIDEKLRDFFSL